MKGNREIYFTREQVKYLKEVFPTVPLGPTSTEASMRHYFGQQSVVQHIEGILDDYYSNRQES